MERGSVEWFLSLLGMCTVYYLCLESCVCFICVNCGVCVYSAMRVCVRFIHHKGCDW